jgi:membrane protease YdiL (CAAX protease family)
MTPLSLPDAWQFGWPGAQSFCRGDVRDGGAAALLRLLVLAPLLEEWIVRAGVQEWLMRRTAPLSSPFFSACLQVLPPALFFSALHWRAGAQVAVQVFLPGLAFGLLYRAARDWRACALAHALSNAAALAYCHPFFQTPSFF